MKKIFILTSIAISAWCQDTVVRQLPENVIPLLNSRFESHAKSAPSQLQGSNENRKIQAEEIVRELEADTVIKKGQFAYHIGAAHRLYLHGIRYNEMENADAVRIIVSRALEHAKVASEVAKHEYQKGSALAFIAMVYERTYYDFNQAELYYEKAALAHSNHREYYSAKERVQGILKKAGSIKP